MKKELKHNAHVIANMVNALANILLIFGMIVAGFYLVRIGLRNPLILIPIGGCLYGTIWVFRKVLPSHADKIRPGSEVTVRLAKRGHEAYAKMFEKVSREIETIRSSARNNEIPSGIGENIVPALAALELRVSEELTALADLDDKIDHLMSEGRLSKVRDAKSLREARLDRVLDACSTVRKTHTRIDEIVRTSEESSFDSSASLKNAINALDEECRIMEGIRSRLNGADHDSGNQPKNEVAASDEELAATAVSS